MPVKSSNFKPKPKTRPIALEGFKKGKYSVSKDGQVYSAKNGDVPLAQHQNKNGRGRGVFVALVDDNGKETRKNVATLVALTYLSNPNNHMLIGFKDGNPENCCVKNLVWLASDKKLKKIRIFVSPTAKKDISYLNGNLKPKRIAQYSLDGTFIREWESIRAAATALKIPGVQACCAGERKSAGGFAWRIIEEGTEPPKHIETGKKRKVVKVDKVKINFSNIEIEQYSLDGKLIHTWQNAKEAGKSFSSSGAYINIIKAARGERRQAFGFVWKFPALENKNDI